MTLDLNKVTDFQKLVMSPTANILLQLAGLDPSKWDISEASYRSGNSTTDVLFHVFISKSTYSAGLAKVSDKGGRRKVKYLYPYRDGQTTDDLGQKPYTYEFDAMIHGQNYHEGLSALLDQFGDPTPGTLTHPVYGETDVVIEDWEIVHEHASRQAVQLKLTFTDHSFDIGQSFQLGGKSTFLKRALNAALGAFALIDAAVTVFTGSLLLANTLRALFTNAMNDYKAHYANNLLQINNAFNQPKGNQSGRDVSTDLPSIVPVSQGGNLNPNGTLASPKSRVSISPNDPFANVPLSSLRSSTITAIATQQAINNVNQLRAEADSIIKQIKAANDGTGSLDFFDTINSIKQTVILMQTALETGLRSSRQVIVKYTTPRLMSVREIAFANNIPLDNVTEIEILNPSLQSLNYVVKGTVVQVPTK